MINLLFLTVICTILVIVIPCTAYSWYNNNFIIDETTASYDLISNTDTEFTQASNPTKGSNVSVVYRDDDSIRAKNIDDIRVIIIDDDSTPRLERVKSYYWKIKSKSWVVYLPEGY